MDLLPPLPAYFQSMSSLTEATCYSGYLVLLCTSDTFPIHKAPDSACRVFTRAAKQQAQQQRDGCGGYGESVGGRPSTAQRSKKPQPAGEAGERMQYRCVRQVTGAVVNEPISRPLPMLENLIHSRPPAGIGLSSPALTRKFCTQSM
eukprot:765988-Hanusia_phi.AAC.17